MSFHSLHFNFTEHLILITQKITQVKTINNTDNKLCSSYIPVSIGIKYHTVGPVQFYVRNSSLLCVIYIVSNVLGCLKHSIFVMVYYYWEGLEQ